MKSRTLPKVIHRVVSYADNVKGKKGLKIVRPEGYISLEPAQLFIQNISSGLTFYNDL